MGGTIVAVTQWLDTEEMAAWRGLIEVSTALHSVIEAQLLKGHALTEGEYAALVVLSEAPGRRLRMCDLAAKLFLTPSGLTRRLDRLVSERFVSRDPSPDDRRVSMATLTDAGFAKLEAAAPDHVCDVRRHLLDHLSRAEIVALASILSGLSAVISQGATAVVAGSP